MTADQQNGSIAPEDPTLDQNTDLEEMLSEEEQAELAAEIDTLLTTRKQAKSATGGRRARPEAKRRGVALPLAVNLTMIALLAGGVVGYSSLTGNGAAQSVREQEGLSTTEGRVVEEIQRSASEQLSQRERRIAEIQQQLQSLREQRQRDAATGERTGASATASQAEEREQELLARLRELESDTETELAALEARSAQESFLFSQLGTLFNDVANAVSEGRIAEARTTLDQARTALAREVASDGSERSETVAALRAGAGAMDAALSFIGAQRTAVAQRSAATDAQQSDLQTQVEELQTQLEASQRRSERLAAEVEGVREELSAARDELQTTRRQLAAARRELATARRELTAARRENSEQAEQIAALEAETETLQSTVSDLRNELAARRRAVEASARSVAEAISETREESEGALLTDLTDAPRQSDREVVELLDTKVRLREVISSEPVRTEHPDLYEDMEAYFTLIGEIKKAEGSRAALEGVNSALQTVIAEVAGGAPDGGQPGPAATAAAFYRNLQTLLVGVLDRLR